MCHSKNILLIKNKKYQLTHNNTLWYYNNIKHGIMRFASISHLKSNFILVFINVSYFSKFYAYFLEKIVSIKTFNLLISFSISYRITFKHNET